jgi:short-subunit dehydrogenase
MSMITTGQGQLLKEERNKRKLFGKHIVITGASSGVGQSAALAFAAYGTKITLAARNQHALDAVADECRFLGAEVQTVVTDVTDAKAMITLANSANDWQGYVDVWINNAGVLAAGVFEDTPMEVHAQVVRTNLLGYMNGAHAILPFFKKRGKGIIINNISVGGFLPVPYGAGYTASKFGLRGFSEALKAELTDWKNIHVCDLFPAFLDTPGILHAGNYTRAALKPAPPVYDPERVAEAMVETVINPRSRRFVTSTSLLLRLAHAALPQVITNITGKVIRKYIKNADNTSPTDGNLFDTVDYGMSLRGGFGFPGRPKSYRKYIAGAAAGLAIAALLFRNK